MRISVVIPLYNKACHVEAALRSALAQTYGPHEVIVIDDGSTDRSEHIARSVADTRIRVFNRSPPGPGGYAARNLGIAHASGDWIAFLDADDTWEREHLRSIAEAIADRADVGCVFGRANIIDGNIPVYRMSERHVPADQPLALADILAGWLSVGRCPLWTGAVAIRKDVLVAAGLFPEGRVKRGGDKDLWFRVVARTRTVYTGQRTANFYQEAMNRVSKNTGHAELPALVETINRMLPDLARSEQALARRLLNQEIAQYARHAARTGARIDLRFLSSLHYPSGLPQALAVAGLLVGGRVLRVVRG